VNLSLSKQENAARNLMAKRLNKPAPRWTVVLHPEPGVWYDFSDMATGQVGQCRMALDGTWLRPPRGTRPVLFEYHPASSRPSGVRRTNSHDPDRP
jgi:hypothetical protein